MTGEKPDLMNRWNNNRVLVGALILYAAVCFLPGIGKVSLFDRDEPRFAEAAREMIVRGDYLVPYFNNEPRLHKPPLIYWVMTGAYRVFGVNEFSARLGSALAGVVTCFLIYLLAQSMFGRSVGILAGVIAASNVMTIAISRAATADSLQLLTVLITFWGFWRLYAGDRRFVSYLLLYGGIALGGLAKGPVVVSVFLLAALLIFVKERRPGFLRELKLVPGILAAAAIVCLWLIPANKATGGDFIRVGIGHHIIDRAFGESMEGHSGPFVYYLILLPITFAPWFAFLPASIRRIWKASDVEGRRVFLFAWAAAPFLLFSFLKTKLPHYVLPAYPALAIITAYGLDAAIRERESLWDHWTGKAGIIVLAVAGLAMMVGLVGFPFYAKLDALRIVSLGPVLLLCAMFYCVLKDTLHRRNDLLAIDLAAGMLLLVLSLSLVYLPTMDKQSAAHVLAGKVRSLANANSEICSIGYKEPTLVFYAQRPVQFLFNWNQLPEEKLNDRNLICLARDKNLNDMPVDLHERLEKVGHASAYLPSKGKWMSWTFLAPKALPSSP